MKLRLIKPTSAATLRRFSAQTQTAPQSDPDTHRVPQILSLLKTTNPETWNADADLHRLLLPAAPITLLKVSRKLGSSQKSLSFFNHVKNSHLLDSPANISVLFQGVFEHAEREEDSRAPAKLLELFKFSKEQKVPLSANSAVLLIRSLGRCKMVEESMEVYSELDPMLRNTHLVNLLLDTMVKCGRIDDALKVFDEMLDSEFGVGPSKLTLDIMLSVLSRNWAGRSLRDEEIFRIVFRLGERGIFPNSVWLTQIVTSFCRNGKCDKGWDFLHGVMRLGGKLRAAPCNALLSGLGRRRDMEKMNVLMNEMKENDIQPDVVTYGILINHLCKLHRVDQALEVFRSMNGGEGCDVKIEPDVVIYNTLIDGLCKVGRQEEGLELMKDMKVKNGCEPNAVTYNSLIDGLFKAGENEKAFGLFDQMNEVGVEANVVTLNTVLDGMCRSGQVGSAVKFLNQMQEKGLKANAVSYTTLITAFCGSNNMDKAMNLFDQMLQSGCFPDAIVYYSLILGLSQSGKMEDAVTVVSKMKKAGFCLDIICYNVLISGFCKKDRLDEALDLFKEMENKEMKPDCVTYNTLISHFSDKGDFTAAREVLKKMTENGFVPNVVTFGALINAYCKAGLLNESMKVYQGMIASSKVSPNVVVYNSLIGAHCKSDEIEAALSLMVDMKNKGVRPDTVTYNAMLSGLRQRNWLEKAFDLMNEMTENACNPNYVTMEVLTEWLSAVGQIDKLQKFVRGYEVSASVQ